MHFSINRYHVLFFERLEKSISRAWIRAENVRRYDGLSESPELSQASTLGLSQGPQGGFTVQSSSQEGDNRIKKAMKAAEAALAMDLNRRREAFCFLNRFKHTFGSPWRLDLDSPKGKGESSNSEKAPVKSPGKNTEE